MDEKLTKRLVLKVTTQKRPSKGEVLATLNDELEINLIRLIEAKNSYIAICHSEEDALKLNNKTGAETLNKLGLSVVNSLAFEARKAIVARAFDYWITSHSQDEILQEFNNKYPSTPCKKVIIMGKNKQLLKLIFDSQEDAKSVANDGFALFHVRVPPYNISIDSFIEVPMCMSCYKMNEHATRNCPTATTIVCSECSEEGHRWTDCKANTKKCLNCSGDHRTTAPQCPMRKQEVNKIRHHTSTNKTRNGTSYSEALRSTTPTTPNMTIQSDSFLIMSAAIMYAHTINAFRPGSFNREVNMILLINNLPKMNFPDDPPSMGLINKINQTRNGGQLPSNEEEQQPSAEQHSTNEEQMEYNELDKTQAETSDNNQNKKRKRNDPRIQYISGNIGLEIYLDPRTGFAKPKNAIWSLPDKQYKFIIPNGQFKRQEVSKLLKNNKIFIQPENIHMLQSVEQYNKLPTSPKTTNQNGHIQSPKQN